MSSYEIPRSIKGCLYVSKPELEIMNNLRMKYLPLSEDIYISSIGIRNKAKLEVILNYKITSFQKESYI